MPIDSNCPACSAMRCHTDDEWKLHHPLAGHGYTFDTGWTRPDAGAAVRVAVIESRLPAPVIVVKRG